ncbi:hypothetical protein HPB51_022352 [Rhipicephalus microplus]|uniref:CCHC-type domain-containing protein n=1 Tax=Rhipicephalus microplus TaxID=6941 RepID=A0A9J6EUT3_RHIMP|nr:hypothetical protein HPB51_022352 [Rhipicephalus microplus]
MPQAPTAGAASAALPTFSLSTPVTSTSSGSSQGNHEAKGASTTPSSVVTKTSSIEAKSKRCTDRSVEQASSASQEAMDTSSSQTAQEAPKERRAFLDRPKKDRTPITGPDKGLAPRKTEVWRTPDNRPLCYHCGEADHVYCHCPYKRLGLRGFCVDAPRPQAGQRPFEIEEYLSNTSRGPSRFNRSPSPYPYQSPHRRSNADFAVEGVRLFLTTISPGVPEARPSTLALLHVRLPPGFTSHAPSQRVHGVRTAMCQRGTTVLVASHTEDKDIFWTLASDAYPFQQFFTETSTFGPVDAGVCCLASVAPQRAPRPQCTVSMPSGAVVLSDPPTVVTQHMDGPQKFVLLSRTSCCLYEKPRPVDMLRGFLQNRATPDEALRAFFALHGEVQASAICLILACNPSDAHLAKRATHALFRYGGEAKLVEHAPTHLASPPVWASTPLAGNQARPLNSFGSPLGAQSPVRPLGWRPSALSTTIVPPQSTAEVEFSGRHHGCYVYFSRLVRPLWTLNLVSPVKDCSLADMFASSIAGQDVENYLQPIVSFQRFLQTFVGLSSESAFANVVAISQSRLDPDSTLHLREQTPRKAQVRKLEWQSI